MRTLHVDTGREMGGGQWQVLYLLEGSRATDGGTRPRGPLPDATLLAPANSPLFREAQRRGVHVIPLSLRALARLARNVDVVHAHDARAHTLAVVAGGAPLVVSRRVGFPVRRSVGSRWKYARAALYLAVSKYVASELTDAGVPEQKIRVVYDGVPIPARATREPGRVVALAGKCEEIVRIGSGIAGISPHFTAKQITSKHFTSEHFTSELWQDLSTASIFVYVSEMEGLGSAALAAMASGVPVIAASAGGLAEVVEHERTGLLIGSPVEPPELAAAIRRLLDDPAAAAEMGRRGRERVMQNFSVEAMRERTLRAYGDISPC